MTTLQGLSRPTGPLSRSPESALIAMSEIPKVAIARKLLTLCYYGLRDGEIRCLARRCRPTQSQVMAAS